MDEQPCVERSGTSQYLRFQRCYFLFGADRVGGFDEQNDGWLVMPDDDGIGHEVSAC